MTVSTSGLLALNYLDPETQWLRLLPLAAGTVAIGTGLAAVMRHHGTAAPGDLAGAITLVGILLVERRVVSGSLRCRILQSGLSQARLARRRLSGANQAAPEHVDACEGLCI